MSINKQSHRTTITLVTRRPNDATQQSRILATSRNHLKALKEARSELSALIILEEARVAGAFD